MKTLSLIAVFLLVSCGGPQKEKNFGIGQKSVSFVDESRNRPLPTEIWYPTLDTLITQEAKEGKKELFKTMETIPNATLPNKKFPLLLISHGTGGNRFSLTWFIERMVKEGYIVVSLDHYGNSTFNKVPREFVKWWERAIDVQYVLTQVLKDNKIGAKINTSRIGGVGFSLGGYTNIALAGGYVDRSIGENDNMEDRKMPAEFPHTDEIIDFENDSLIVSSYKRYKDRLKDDRIKAFFVMAPAIGFGFHSKGQTEKITAPIFIVAGKGDDLAPVKTNAKKYHTLIKTSEIYLFDEHVGHYVFLNEATAFGKEIAPEITTDHPKVDRKEIHLKTLELALHFFQEKL
ncbi:alpha/beta hydrolase family protein [Zobellia uliginosa]|uniref:alpha/beta hydrolase family protein n=1 Tax=Zobellia uliginosa TaxID=143224 RepID=UPI0026E3E106|nr:hypothetical protein [Zobellia uliginosa]MDO6516789.1 hypothetical protein [Zobellia uliginosa]